MRSFLIIILYMINLIVSLQVYNDFWREVTKNKEQKNTLKIVRMATSFLNWEKKRSR